MDAHKNGKSSTSQREALMMERSLVLAQREMLKSLQASLGTLRTIWCDMPNKSAHLKRMFEQQIKLARMVSQFYRDWDWSHCKSSGVLNELDRRYVQLVEIQMELVVLRLEAFMDKYMCKLEAFKDAVIDMDPLLTLTETSMDALIAAKSIKDLEKVPVPDLNGIQNAIGDVEALAQEWERMQLKEKFQRCVRQFQEVRN